MKIALLLFLALDPADRNEDVQFPVTIRIANQNKLLIYESWQGDRSFAEGDVVTIDWNEESKHILINGMQHRPRQKRPKKQVPIGLLRSFCGDVPWVKHRLSTLIDSGGDSLTSWSVVADEYQALKASLHGQIQDVYREALSAGAPPDTARRRAVEALEASGLVDSIAYLEPDVPSGSRTRTLLVRYVGFSAPVLVELRSTRRSFTQAELPPSREEAVSLVLMFRHLEKDDDTSVRIILDDGGVSFRTGSAATKKQVP